MYLSNMNCIMALTKMLPFTCSSIFHIPLHCRSVVAKPPVIFSSSASLNRKGAISSQHLALPLPRIVIYDQPRYLQSKIPKVAEMRMIRASDEQEMLMMSISPPPLALIAFYRKSFVSASASQKLKICFFPFSFGFINTSFCLFPLIIFFIMH